MDDISLRQLCEVYAFELLANLDVRPGVVLARVRDQDGQSHVLKRGGQGQLIALRTWGNSGHVVRIHRELDDGLYLMELLSGPTLAEQLLCNRADAEAVGLLLRDLHTVPAHHGAPILRSGTQQWLRLTRAERQFAAGLTKRMHNQAEETFVLLHGDLVPSNIIRTPERLVLIDPLGLRGPPAWDLATLHVATVGRGGSAILPGLVSGYGSAPGCLDDFVLWRLLQFVDRNRTAGRVEFLRHLEPWLAEVVAATR